MTTPKIRARVGPSLLVSAALALGGCARPRSDAPGSPEGRGGDPAIGGAGGDPGTTTGGAGAEPTGGAGGGSAGRGGEGGSGREGTGGAAPDPTELGLTSNGCAGGTCLNPECKPLGVPAAPGRFPEVGFEARAPYIPHDVIVPTLDDVPDRPYTSADGALYTSYGAGDWTIQILDFLEANQLHFDFFINAANFCDLASRRDCGAVVTRIIKSHNPGNHTVHHVHMGSAAAYDPKNLFNSGCRALGNDSKLVCEDEITGVESTVGILSNGGINHLTRFRAPYGEPFAAGGAALPEVAAVVARFAVHVGWAIESGDTDRDPGGKARDPHLLVDNIVRAIGSGPGQGAWGILLLRGIYPWSLAELTSLFDPRTGYVQTHGFRLGTVEDVICWKYGRHSWELISQVTGHQIGPN